MQWPAVFNLSRQDDGIKDCVIFKNLNSMNFHHIFFQLIPQESNSYNARNSEEFQCIIVDRTPLKIYFFHGLFLT